jgi:type VI secretion system secreted protein VgrG
MRLTTPLGPDALFLTGFTGREGISQLFRFQLDLLASNGKQIPFEKLLGQMVNVQLDMGGKDRFFNGIVSRFSQGSRDEEFIAYRAEVVPSLWLLTRRVQSRIFQHQSVPDILKKVLKGLDVVFELQGKFHPRNYCVQYRESDFAFASRLMEEEGIYYYFEFHARGHKLIVANTAQSHRPVPEPSTLIFDDIEGGTRPEARISEWEKSQEVRSGKVSLWDHCFELPDSKLEIERLPLDKVAVGQVTHALKLPDGDALEVYDYPGGYARYHDGIDQHGAERPADLNNLFKENQKAATLRMEQETVAGLQIRGAGNCRQLVSGHKFTLSRHFNADGDYVLTSVEHRASLGGDFRSGEGMTFDYDNHFTCIPAALPFRPARVTPRPRVDGAQTAVVVGPPREEIFTDKYGRVKVQFPWDRHGKYDADSSCWVRVATPWAGKGWGGVHVPRIGQEVVVDFLEGDPDRPLIVGSVFNADQMPPFTLPAAKQVSGFKTNSYPTTGGSNEITIDDTKGKEKMTIHAQHDQNVTVDHDQTTTVHNNRTTTVDVNSTETVKGKKTTTVNGTVLETYNDALSTIVKSGVVLVSTAANISAVAATEVMLNTGASTLLMKSDGTIELIGVKIIINGKSLVDVDAPKIEINGGAETLMGVGGQTVLCDGGKVAVSGAQIDAVADGTHNIKGSLVKIN